MMNGSKYRNSEQLVDSGIEWLGEIPRDWKKSKIKYFYSFMKGKNASKLTKEYLSYHQGKYPVYSGQTGNNGILGYLDEYEFDLDSCLFTTTVGARVMSSMQLSGKFNLSQNCLIMKKVKKSIEDKFVFYWLNPLFLFEKAMIPQYMQPSLRFEDLNTYFVYIPTIIEQKIIANFLDYKTLQLDSIINKKEQLILKLEEAKKSLISEVVTGKVKIVNGKPINRKLSEMADSGESIFGFIPSCFYNSKIKYHGKFKAGLSKGGEYFGSGYPFVTYKDVYNNAELSISSGLALSSINERLSFSVKYKDVFFTRTSESTDDIGISSICSNTIINGTFSGFIIRYRIVNKEEFNFLFLKYYFQNYKIKKYFEKQLNIVTRASLSQERLKELPFFVPTLDEQVIIGNYLEDKVMEINDLIEKLERQIIKAKESKQSLIFEAVTGKIDLRDWQLVEQKESV